MNLITLAVVVIAGAVLIQVIVAIPAILQLKKTLVSAEKFLGSMEGSLKTLIEEEVRPAVRTANDTMAEVGGLTKSARASAEKIEDVAASLQELGSTVRSINSMLDTGVRKQVANISAYAAGIKVGFVTLVDAIRHLKQKEVQ
jgi:uncharacterized protein YoxC